MPFIGSSKTSSTSLQNTQTWNDSFNSSVNEAFNLSVGDTVLKIGSDPDEAGKLEIGKIVALGVIVLSLVFLLSG